ncbi:hypothetical protein NDN08_007013 [Rhodosorus marinus]|uniref:Amidase domain-containing protein n=1 Tax=Rhodosorus marinus TaxID=101924 RepID=A0AAV8UJ20_9RHOD|nr:hypothetical protein NDN08_007013 [Rhodosorus marinus]
MDKRDHGKLVEVSVAELQERFDNRVLNSVEAVEGYLKRIEDLDQSGPTLRSVIEINPDAVEIARRLDQERADKGPRGPLHGVPVLLKQCIGTADKMSTNCGCLALEGYVAPKDAFIVCKLREAGAVILGKTNMSEWGFLRSDQGCSGWSTLGGQTRNPYVLDRTPCGSSSGSGTAVSASFCTVAIGAETDGSVTRPAAMTGIVGLKPTIGLLSRTGVMPFSPTQDTVGPMGRCVRDVAMLLTALTGVDADDPVTEKSKDYVGVDYTKFLVDEAGTTDSILKGIRFGFDVDTVSMHQGADAAMVGAITNLERLGAEIVEIHADGYALFNENETKVVLTEFKDSLETSLEKTGRLRGIPDLIAYNRKHADRVMPFFGQEILEKVASFPGKGDESYLTARKASVEGARAKIDDLLETHKLDAIVALTNSLPPYVIDPLVGDNLSNIGGCSTTPAMAGYPHISVPGPLHKGLPWGISMYASAFSEGQLLRFAHAFEVNGKFRRIPTYKATLE